MTIDERLTQLGIQLPKAAAPVASYVPVVTVGQMAYVSGQLPFIDGELVTGRLGCLTPCWHPRPIRRGSPG